MSGPEPAEGGEPCIDLLQRFGFQAVEAALCVDGRFNETGVSQHSQVLRDGGLGHMQLSLDLTHRLLR